VAALRVGAPPGAGLRRAGDELIGNAASLADLGAEVAPGLYEAELDFLRRSEWACTGEDVLWRRSKLGLHYDRAERARVGAWMDRAAAAAPATSDEMNEMKDTPCS
jgi:glycerol-3-phosphate dehydrogenase